GVDRGVVQDLLDAQELVVLGDALGAGRGAGLDLAAGHGDGQVGAHGAADQDGGAGAEVVEEGGEVVAEAGGPLELERFGGLLHLVDETAADGGVVART
ncbi:hypothetical protein ADL26_11290, partial [Thermoactinomyces vulgaris]